MDLLEFWTICSSNGIVLDKEQIERVERYQRELLYWNAKVNLISRKDEEFLLERHILHSMALLTGVELPQKARCLDVGTGGGFPGIPVKIARPDLNMVLADSIGKKISLTEMFAKHTELRGISAVNIRVEELARNKQYIRAFDVVMARAVAPVADIVNWTIRLLKPGGFYVLLKGGDLKEEKDAFLRQYPSAIVTEQQIRLRGIPWFEEQEKKILTVKFSS